MSINNKTEEILNVATSKGRISAEDALFLFNNATLHQLGRAADQIKQERHPDNIVAFVIDRNINYTNICINKCRFCAFYRDLDNPEGYLLNADDVLKKVKEAISNGATQIMLQGGLHPEVKLDYYTAIFKAIKDTYDIVIHSLSPPEIIHIAKNSGLTTQETIQTLIKAGLDSIPGGGAEILADNVRQKISPLKIKSSEWLDVMRLAHVEGLCTTATMMFGIGESLNDRITHLESIRTLQDQSGKFRAFIPWTFQPGHTDIGGSEVPAADYLKTLAISRIYLDNITTIQGSWLTQGEGIGQMSLFFGANDLGSTMLEENVVRSTGVHNKMDVEKIVRLIKECGFIPAQRDTEYNILKIF